MLICFTLQLFAFYADTSNLATSSSLTDQDIIQETRYRSINMLFKYSLSSAKRLRTTLTDIDFTLNGGYLGDQIYATSGYPVFSPGYIYALLNQANQETDRYIDNIANLPDIYGHDERLRSQVLLAKFYSFNLWRQNRVLQRLAFLNLPYSYSVVDTQSIRMVRQIDQIKKLLKNCKKQFASDVRDCLHAERLKEAAKAMNAEN